jgi:hypothetical protein
MATTSIGEAHIAPGRRHRWRDVAAIAAVAAILAVAVAYACVPRQADLTGFGAESLARRETALWREYYEKRYLALVRDIYDVSRLEYNFSPLDSVRIAVAAASAARTFQPSRSRAEAEAALPALTTYFRILASGAKIKVDVEDAARTELAWWQARREEAGPDQVGLIVARVATLLYGVDGDDVRRSGILRAQAMAYRDARGDAITDADWAAIEDQLRTAYGLFRRALAR